MREVLEKSQIISESEINCDSIVTVTDEKSNNVIENTTPICYNKTAVNEFGCLEGENPMNKQSNNQQKQLITALYERLSNEDERLGESGSIQNQKKFLEDYAKKQGFTNIHHYSDDGISGVSFEREAWQQLMAEVEAGNVGILCVKDMSRLGRNHVLVGTYLETFRLKNVRFIAIGENIDSIHPETLEFAPFINLVNEWYARDTSRKVKTIKRAKGMAGNYASSFPPYGYRKCSEDKTKWIIDTETVDVVRRIFRMVMEGYGVCSIATILQKDKIYSPGYYDSLQPEGKFRNKAFEDPYRWHGTTVDAIITRMEYMGMMVNFKTEKLNFKDKRSTKIPKEKWVIFEGKHEPIIDAETWHLVNEIRNKTRKTKPDSLGEPHMLSGILYCVDCGSKMNNQRRRDKKNPGKTKDYYVCGRSKHGSEFCTEHGIQANAIKDLVLSTLRTVNTFAKENEEEFTRQINEIFSSQQADAAKAQRKKLKASQNRYAELDRLIQRIYEDHVREKISDKRFEVLSAQYEQEQAELEHTIAKLQSDLDSFDDSTSRAARFLELTRRYKDFGELTAPILYEFVDRIEIHERADRKVKITSQKVDIYLNFIGTYSPPIEDVELSPEEITAHEKRMAKVMWQREYRRRRKENDGKPLGTYIRQGDNRTLEEKAADEAARQERRREYNRQYLREYHARKRAEKAAAEAVENVPMVPKSAAQNAVPIAI